MEAWGLENREEEDRTSRSYHCNKAASDHVTASGATAKMHCQVGGHHCEADWEKLVPTFMDFLWMQ
jgi:hypothetical protein